MAATRPERRKASLTGAEISYRQGYRRRADDHAERRAYFVLLAILSTLFIGLGVVAWLAR